MLHTACGRSMRPLQHCCGSCKRVQCQQSKAARPLTTAARAASVRPAAERSCTLVKADDVPERQRPCRRRRAPRRSPAHSAPCHPLLDCTSQASTCERARRRRLHRAGASGRTTRRESKSLSTVLPTASKTLETRKVPPHSNREKKLSPQNRGHSNSLVLSPYHYSLPQLYRSAIGSKLVRSA